MAKALSLAYAALDYNVLILGPQEAKWLEESGASIPEHALFLSKEPTTTVVTVPQGKVGLVIFPLLPKDKSTPSDAAIAAVTKAAKELQARADIVIGISSWGLLGEEAFVKTGGPVLDVLLGAGSGPGVAGRFAYDNQTFWTRAYDKGRSANVIHITQWPSREGKRQWIKDKTLRLDFRTLVDTTPTDDAMRKLLSGFKLPAHTAK